MTRIISPFATGTVLDPEQGGTGQDLSAAGQGQVLMGSGNDDAPIVAGNILGAGGVSVDLSTPGQITISATGGGATDAKDSVNLATAAALPACTYDNGVDGEGATLTGDANGALTVDGEAVAVDDRILVKNQVAGEHNGIYTVTQTGNAGSPFILTRSDDCNTSSNITTGIYTFVVDGATNAEHGFVLTTESVIVVGTTVLAFAETSNIIAGTGLTRTGNTLSVDYSTIQAAMALVFAPLPIYSDVTVTMTATSGTITLAAGSDVLRFVQEGNKYSFTGQLTVQSVSSPSGTLRIAGLPVNCATGVKNSAAVAVQVENLTGAAGVIQGKIIQNSTSITLSSYAGGTSSAAAGFIQAGSVICVSGFFNKNP